MSNQLLRSSKVVTSQLRTDLPDFKVGSVVEVYYKIQEGGKERIQVFKGIVTNRHGGSSMDATFTVLKNSTFSVKVERTFPLNSPNISEIRVISYQRARRSNLKNLHTVKDPLKSVRFKPLKVKSTGSSKASDGEQLEAAQNPEVVQEESQSENS